MLRKNYNEELEKLSLLIMNLEIISKRENEILQKFRAGGMYEESEEYQELAKEQDNVRKVEEFLREEILVFERNTKLFRIPKSKDIFASTNFIRNCLSEMEHEEVSYYYDKYKDDNAIIRLYSSCNSSYDRIFDFAHFEELVKYYDDGKLLHDVKEASFSFEILDKEHEEVRELNKYKISVVCDNGLEFELFLNEDTSYYEYVKVYSKDYLNDYAFTGTLVYFVDSHINLLKMAKTVISKNEGKSYKVYFK